MENKWRNVLSGTGFYATLAACLLIVAVGGYFLLLRDKPSPAADEPLGQGEASVPETVPSSGTPSGLEEPPSESASAPATDLDVPEGPAVVETISPEPAETAPVMPEAEVDPTPVVAEAPRLVVQPVNGEVLTVFSADELMYNPTLADWRTHEGLDISAKPGTTVLAASPGTVSAVDEDPLMGTYVAIDHDGGYQTLYANLQTTPSVVVGEEVSAGQVIGAVGTTAVAESSQSPHLHFAVTKNGNAVNPSEFLNQ